MKKNPQLPLNKMVQVELLVRQLLGGVNWVHQLDWCTPGFFSAKRALLVRTLCSTQSQTKEKQTNRVPLASVFITMAPTLRSKHRISGIAVSPIDPLVGKYRTLQPHEVKQEPESSDSSRDSDEDLFHDPADEEARSDVEEEREEENEEEEDREEESEEEASENEGESLGTNDSTRSTSAENNSSDVSHDSFIARDDSTIERDDSAMDDNSDSAHESSSGESNGSMRAHRRRSDRLDQQDYYADYEEYSTSPSDDDYSIRTTESEFSDDDSDVVMEDRRTQTRITDYFHYV